MRKSVRASLGSVGRENYYQKNLRQNKSCAKVTILKGTVFFALVNLTEGPGQRVNCQQEQFTFLYAWFTNSILCSDYAIQGCM